MLIKPKRPWDLPYSDVTPEASYHSRRDFIRVAAAGAIGAVAASVAGRAEGAQTPQGLADLPNVKKSSYVTDAEIDPVNSYAQITNYNNYYEFGTAKTDPARYSARLTTRPWTVKIDGMVAKPGDYQIDDLIKNNQLEERIYRHRCVEAWSYVVPWVGFPLKTIIDKVQPTSQAKYIEFTTLMRASEMPGLQTANIPFPYIEGLRHRRSDAPAYARRRRAVREDAAEPERRADPHPYSLEVRLQEREVDRAHPVHRPPAEEHVGRGDAE